MQLLEVAAKKFSGNKDVPKMSKNIERLESRAKFFETAWRSAFLVKVVGAESATLLKNKLHYKCFSTDLPTF